MGNSGFSLLTLALVTLAAAAQEKVRGHAGVAWHGMAQSGGVCAALGWCGQRLGAMLTLHMYTWNCVA